MQHYLRDREQRMLANSNTFCVDGYVVSRNTVCAYPACLACTVVLAQSLEAQRSATLLQATFFRPRRALKA